MRSKKSFHRNKLQVDWGKAGLIKILNVKRAVGKVVIADT